MIIIEDTHLDNTTAGRSSLAHILPEKQRFGSTYHATLYSPSKEKHNQTDFHKKLKNQGQAAPRGLQKVSEA